MYVFVLYHTGRNYIKFYNIHVQYLYMQVTFAVPNGLRRMVMVSLYKLSTVEGFNLSAAAVFSQTFMTYQ
jgi:hypothetical protein